MMPKTDAGVKKEGQPHRLKNKVDVIPKIESRNREEVIKIKSRLQMTKEIVAVIVKVMIETIIRVTGEMKGTRKIVKRVKENDQEILVKMQKKSEKGITVEVEAAVVIAVGKRGKVGARKRAEEIRIEAVSARTKKRLTTDAAVETKTVAIAETGKEVISVKVVEMVKAVVTETEIKKEVISVEATEMEKKEVVETETKKEVKSEEAAKIEIPMAVGNVAKESRRIEKTRAIENVTEEVAREVKRGALEAEIAIIIDIAMIGGMKAIGQWITMDVVMGQVHNMTAENPGWISGAVEVEMDNIDQMGLDQVREVQVTGIRLGDDLLSTAENHFSMGQAALVPPFQ
mmetsp:Transcript_21144/g.24484  ORF Transcript_21144/g.24484 Transcript_21144/m.24484 type:complete len:344 (+) Transcript_21144:2253-3284(+)